MLVRLTRKLADMIDGVDLSAYRVGQNLHLSATEARLLIAEGWAEMVERRKRPRTHAGHPFLSRAS
jgi:hypothetical protein